MPWHSNFTLRQKNCYQHLRPGMLDLSQSELAAIKNILDHHLNSGVEVFAYGSRTKQAAREFSDLDLLIKTEKRLEPMTVAEMKDDFSASDLPFMVDLSEWTTMSVEFRESVKKDMVRIMP